MENVKKFLFAIILLGVIAFVWVGMKFSLEERDTSLSENVENYTKPIAGTFKMKEVEEVYEKTEKSFLVSPADFLELVEKEN